MTSVSAKHFTPAQLAEAWGLSPETIRKLFRDESGVLKIGGVPSTLKQGYGTLRIPHQDVAERVHRGLSA
jgi:hypothetical protein